MSAVHSLIASADIADSPLNRLAAYYGDPIAAVPSVEVQPLGLNPRAWPPCKCGGNVNCETYDPDTSKPLWGQGEAA